MQTRILQISRISGYLDTNPEPVTVTWGQFIRRCMTPAVRGALSLEQYLVAGKDTRDRQKDGPAIIAGRYSRTGTRNQSDLESLAMVTLDLDDGRYSFDELCEKLECFEAVVFSSYSSSPEKPKHRAYLPVRGGITGSLKPTLGRILDYFDEHVGHLDPACRKPGQLFYSPAHPPGVAHLYQCRHLSGYVLDPADFPETEPAHRSRSIQPATPERIATGTRPGEIYNARANWADLLEPLGWQHSHGVNWTRPGKRFGVSASVLDAGLYIHSSAPETAPLICGKSYTLFGAYAAIHHQGNYSTAGKALRQINRVASGY